MLYQSPRLRLECDEQVATLRLDANVLTLELLHDIGRAIEVVKRSRAIDVLVIRSARPGVFLTGPDLDEYTGLTDATSRREFAAMGQETFRRLHDLGPDTATVALIDGECRNGGLELALACDFRLAVARPETRLGFDHAESGLFPCWGATQRLPRLIGLAAALQLLVGSAIPARAARQLGLVDHAFGPRAAKTELAWFVADVQDHGRRPRRRWLRLRELPLWADATIFKPFAKQVPSDSHLRPMVEAVRRGWRFGPVEGEAAERAVLAAFGHQPQSTKRCALARRRQTLAGIWREVPVPRRIGFVRLNRSTIRLAVTTLAAGGSLVAGNGDTDLLRREVLQAVDRGAFNVIEAEQKLQQVSMPAADEELDRCELVFANVKDLLDLDRRLPVQTVIAVMARELPLHKLLAPERVVAARFGACLTAEVVPTRWTDETTTARLFRWLESAGYWTTVIEPAPAAVLEPAA